MIKVVAILILAVIVAPGIFVYYLFRYLDNKETVSVDTAFNSEKEYEVEIVKFADSFNPKCIISGHNWYFIGDDYAICSNCGQEIRKIEK